MLVGFEIKKILKRKSTWVAFIVLLLMQLYLALSGNIGATYVDDKFVETHAKRNQIDRKNGLSLSGRNIDDTLLHEMQNAYAKVGDMGSIEYLLSDTYQSEVRPYSEIYTLINSWISDTSYQIFDLTEEELYQIKRNKQENMYEFYDLSEKERAYWDEKEEKLPDTITYQYATAYLSLVDMNGPYMTCMLITFLIAICMINVFIEEHNKKTDQLILCTRYGRQKQYFAKIIAGSLVALIATSIFAGVSIIGNFICYGTEGFNAMIQTTTEFWYSYDLSVGEALIIMLGILILASVLVSIFAMVFAELLHNSIGAMAVIVGGLFAVRLVPIPISFGFLSQIWNMVPINLLKGNQGFVDLRLVSLFGIQLTSWQFAPILYVILGAIIVLLGKRVYCNFQISGR
ncbi:ABC transporter permease subunit [Anaerosporobacter sp.]